MLNFPNKLKPTYGKTEEDNWWGVSKKVWSDSWSLVLFSLCFTRKRNTIWNENLAVYQKSLGVFFVFWGTSSLLVKNFLSHPPPPPLTHLIGIKRFANCTPYWHGPTWQIYSGPRVNLTSTVQVSLNGHLFMTDTSQMATLSSYKLPVTLLNMDTFETDSWCGSWRCLSWRDVTVRHFCLLCRVRLAHFVSLKVAQDLKLGFCTPAILLK